jgi:hypothetical protein
MPPSWDAAMARAGRAALFAASKPAATLPTAAGLLRPVPKRTWASQ